MYRDVIIASKAVLLVSAALLATSALTAFANDPPKTYEYKKVAPEDVELREDAAVVTGHVFDDKDQAIGGALVVLLGESGYGYATTGADGSFVIPNMAPGTYVAHGTAEGRAEQMIDNVEIQARTTLNLEFHLPGD
jgi:hypothetical protein